MTEITPGQKGPNSRSESSHNATKKPRYALTCISNLSEELRSQIFAELPKSDVYLNVPIVCTRWNHLYWDKELHWKKIDAGKEVSKETLMKWISSAPRLEHLCLRHRNDTNEILMQVSKNCENLKTLKIVNKWSFTIEEEPLTNMIVHCSKFHYFEFQGGRIQGLHFFSLLRRLLRNVRHKNFAYRGLINMEQLRKLGVTANNARNELVKHLLQKDMNVYAELTIRYKNKRHEIIF